MTCCCDEDEDPWDYDPPPPYYGPKTLSQTIYSDAWDRLAAFQIIPILHFEGLA